MELNLGASSRAYHHRFLPYRDECNNNSGSENPIGERLERNDYTRLDESIP
jgi:hypothetical protein